MAHGHSSPSLRLNWVKKSFAIINNYNECLKELHLSGEGKREAQDREDTCILIADSYCSAAETNTTL